MTWRQPWMRQFQPCLIFLLFLPFQFELFQIKRWPNIQSIQSNSYFLLQSNFSIELPAHAHYFLLLIPSLRLQRHIEPSASSKTRACFRYLSQYRDHAIRSNEETFNQLRQKSNTENTMIPICLQSFMNSKRNTNLYDLSREIEDQENKAFENQAKKIVNAYREVQQLKVVKPKPIHHKQPSQSKPQPQSSYALKVKQTLNQLKSSKTKEIESLSKFVVQPSNHRSAHPDETKLQKAAVNKMFSTLQDCQGRIIHLTIKKIEEYALEDEKKEREFIKQFRKFKMFRAWKQEVVLAKLERQRQHKPQILAEMFRAEELANEYRVFSLLKKSLKGWRQATIREIKRKAYEQQIRRLQLQKMIRQESNNKKDASVQKNHQLQNKLRGFLDGLKHKIQDKDRLRTIKENTEESDPNIKVHSEPIQEEEKQNRFSEYREKDEDEQGHTNREHSNAQNNYTNQVIIQPPDYSGPQKPMTNEQLLKKRKQLEDKHKKRKDALEKLRKEKEDKKRQQELQRMHIEKEVEAEQKRIKQEKYKQFLKNKQQQEQWQRRESSLQQQAEKFNTRRLLKYYGWLPLSKAKLLKKKRGDQIYQTLLLIIYRIKGKQFIENLDEFCSKVLQSNYRRMDQRYRRQLLSKALTLLNKNKIEQLQNKEELNIRHQVNLVKICFAEWKRAHPKLAIENFDWERPRNKRAEEFHRLQLMHKSFQALRENKVEEQRNRLISEQKKKIKSKIKDMLEDEDHFNYEQFL